MSGRLRACTSYQRTALTDGWEMAPAPGTAWARAGVPGTVASSLRDAAEWSLDSAPRRFDAEEWWYRTRFSAKPAEDGERLILGFDGLATCAEVRLNGRLLLNSTDMFMEHRCDVSAVLQPDNELTIRFTSLDALLAVRRRRARWRTPMVSHQQLRWVRTTLLGRTPGWSPPAAPVGPWRPVWLERRRLVDVGEHRLLATVVDGRGRVSLSCEVSVLRGATLQSAHLVVERGGQRVASKLTLQPDLAVHGDLELPNVDLWWPHTHGDPALYDVRLQLAVSDGSGVAHGVDIDLGRVGFRSLRLERDSGRFAFEVNGRKVFCRGASWTPLDCVSLQASSAAYGAAFASLRDAGMNMLRVPGPMVYENDEFLDLCDSTGILLWQDFMFANMDYPADDAGFAADVQREARQQLARLQARPCLAMLCGNSEGAQQAAMSGAARECWAPPLFETELASWAKEICPDTPYVPSSTHGGAFPFQATEGVTSYYGVGAYLLPLSDARRSGVRFASECLAFANVPENETLSVLAQDQALRCHHPRWKERVPRDLGAGWDFDDVRDHYLSQLFRLDPAALRYSDHSRYLQLSRAVSGEVMAATFAEWRRAESTCGGALLWFFRDLWPGAGWGVTDSAGLPKAAYYYLKRVLQPLALFITDEGTNGLMIHIANDAPVARHARLELQQFRFSRAVGRPASQRLDIGPASTRQVAATDLYEGFMDLSYAYRFGPVPYDILHARVISEHEATLAETFYFPQGLPNALAGEVGLSAEAAVLDADTFRLTVRCRDFAQSVHVEMPGFVADDQYFHMAPESSRALTVRRLTAAGPLEGTVHALNSVASCRISGSS